MQYIYHIFCRFVGHYFVPLHYYHIVKRYLCAFLCNYVISDVGYSMKLLFNWLTGFDSEIWAIGMIYTIHFQIKQRRLQVGQQ